MAVFALLLVAAGPTFAGQGPVTPAPVPALAAPSANCGAPALALPAPPMTPAPTAEFPDFMEPAARLGYCHCGCSSVRTCRTSADCGGASCDQTISCC
ncbi:MAG TPA: hypothetical protein VHC97_23205 [Thermoanaerobaculia bacterium]|nr:hypothetical protein [Thermoanaerobaculia bacterium]